MGQQRCQILHQIHDLQVSCCASYFVWLWDMSLLTKEEWQIQAFEMKCFRKLLWIFYREQKMNLCMQLSHLTGRSAGVCACTVKQEKLKWFGHITWHDTLPKTVEQGEVMFKVANKKIPGWLTWRSGPAVHWGTLCGCKNSPGTNFTTAVLHLISLQLVSHHCYGMKWMNSTVEANIIRMTFLKGSRCRSVNTSVLKYMFYCACMTNACQLMNL